MSGVEVEVLLIFFCSAGGRFWPTCDPTRLARPGSGYWGTAAIIAERALRVDHLQGIGLARDRAAWVDSAFTAYRRPSQRHADHGLEEAPPDPRRGAGPKEHIAALEFQKQTGTRFTIVPYRGGAPALHDLVAGQIDLMLATAADSVEHVRGGSIKAFAIMAKSRSPAAPNILTVDEAGLPGLYFSNWAAFFAPSATPKNVIAKLNAAIMIALADPTVRTRLADIGQEIPPREQQRPEALRALQKAEIEKWWPIIKAAGIKAE
jgi:hypothetical protein